MSELKRLVNQRKYLRKCITENFNGRDQFPSFARSDREKLQLQFDQWVPELKDLNQRILTLKYEQWGEEEEDRKAQEEFDSCQNYNDKLLSCLVAIKDSSNLAQSPINSDPNHSARSLLKSPIAPLPKYCSSDEEDLARFFEEFEDTLSKFQYPEYDKLLLLKQQISGRALVLVESLEADRQGYTHAKELLLKALASEETQMFKVLRQLSQLKLTPQCDPYEYFSKVRLITERVRKLKISVDNVLQYFIWEGLNESFKTHLTQITNSSKPALRDIMDKFFEASERYCSQTKKVNHSKPAPPKNPSINVPESTGLAVDVKYSGQSNFKPCSLCSKIEGKQADHPIHKCTKFDNAKSKCEKLKYFRGCLKCSNIQHSSKFCKYKFHNRCKHCSEWHFSFLCERSAGQKTTLDNDQKNSDSLQDRDKNKEKVKNNESKKVTGSLVNIVEAFQSDSDMHSVLPTFTASLEGKKLRCLKDSGCQCNFILTEIADQYDLPAKLENISLVVNGINASQTYNTKIVEANLLIGGKNTKIEALCIPSINVNLKLPQLGQVVQGFGEKGYILADESLSGDSCDIQDIHLILGTRSAYCLPEHEQLFGSNLESIYSETPAGILLKGNIGQMLVDLSFLPYVGCAGVASAEVSENLVANILTTDNTCFSADCILDEALRSPCIDVLDENGEISEFQLQKAADHILNESSQSFIKMSPRESDSEESELNKKLIKFAIDSMTRDKDGRIVVPLLWNSQVSHLLGTNRQLAKSVLESNLKKLYKERDKLLLMNKVFKEQEEMGIIKRIDDLEEYIRTHPSHSFLPHMGIFRMDRDTTKCRIVYLSNLCQSKLNEVSISHNQAIYPGPNLNQKLSSSLMHLRFGQKLLCFDICKAFNNLSLSDLDSSKLLCLWYRNVEKEDFTVVGYRNVRLSFGLRCSPALLLLSLYKILVLDVEHDSFAVQKLKKIIYQLCYMDNCAVAYDSSEELLWAYQQLVDIFQPYKFDLQQYSSNDCSLQTYIDDKLGTQTKETVKLLGLSWNRTQDTLYTKAINLNTVAKTKREVLQTVASQFDLFNFNGPLLNRSRIFLHQLQCNIDLDWDQELNVDLKRQWYNIAKQANSSSITQISRFVGSREDMYRLVAFSDSSKDMYGVVIYIHNLSTGSINFVLAKNRIVNKSLESKSMPSLELQGITLAVEEIIGLYNELSGSSCLMPINISELQVYSDSLVALSWVHGYSVKLGKVQKLSVFVQNRLNMINEMCNKHPISFSFVSGEENPADCITRSLSSKQLKKTNYFSGPKLLLNKSSDQLNMQDTLEFTIPALPIKNYSLLDTVQSLFCTMNNEVNEEHYSALSRSSSYHKLVSVYRRVLIFINKIKARLKVKNPKRFEYFNCHDTNHNYFAEATKLVIRRDQQTYFPEVFEYFASGSSLLKDIPKLVGQLNVYVDQAGLLRVRSKMHKLRDNHSMRFPLLISKDSPLTKLIILDYHERFAHAGCYRLLSEIRKTFWISNFFSVVKKVIRSCVTCRRFNERTIKLNQNCYRNFRVNPPEIPFRYIFVDYMGPFTVRSFGKKVKLWILCFTCTWSRAINLKVCIDMSVKEYLRAFQLHTFEFGLPELCISDQGSQLVAGGNVIMDFLKDPEVKAYLEENGIKNLQFEQYFKGNSALGSMVESCVKLTKRCLFGSIRNNVLDLKDFEFLVCQTVHLLNRRPIAFKESLRDTDLNSDTPDPITPECLIRGYDLVSVNLVPELQRSPDVEADQTFSISPDEKIRDTYTKLRKVRSNLIDIYHSEFLTGLFHQAANVKDRYKPVKHTLLQKNDVVLIKEPYSKPNQYPMGIVRDVTINDLGEVTGVSLKKGRTGEVTKRHASNLIFLFRPEIHSLGSGENFEEINAESTAKYTDNKPKRKAAEVSRSKTKEILKDLE